MIQPTYFDNFRVRLTNYIPHTPTKKQRAYLWLPHEEAFYGGAAGGGKSDALLMAALQYVDVPGYSAIIVRKTLADSRQPGSIISRAREWLGGTNATWVSAENCWYFPTSGNPARLAFGKLSRVGDTDQFQGAEYQCIAIDEATQLYEHFVDYVTSRLRRPECPEHKDKMYPDSCKACAEYGMLSKVPLRVRMASNPGGIGALWVKRRYDIRKAEGKKTPNGRQLYCGHSEERPHIPAFVEDNPFLDREAYAKQLAKLKDPVVREQLLSGDWGVSDEGRFKPSWVRRYSVRYPYFELPRVATWQDREMQTFIMIDPAASVKNTPGSKELTKKLASYTVGAVFSLTPDGHMLVRRVERHQSEVPETKHMIRRLLQQFPSVQFVGMEFSSLSIHLYQVLQSEGFNMRAMMTGNRDKISRSVSATNEMEQGRIWLPEESSIWLQDFEDEIFTWTGDPDQTDDQVDALSYAAIYKQEQAASYGYGIMHAYDLPSVI